MLKLSAEEWYTAIEEKDILKCMLLVEKLVDVDDIINDHLQTTALMLAARYGLKDVVDVLLLRGASVTKTDQNLQTSLHRCVRHGHLDCAVALIKAGSPLEARDIFGQTPLMLASTHGQLECAVALVDAGAHVDISVLNTATD